MGSSGMNNESVPKTQPDAEVTPPDTLKRSKKKAHPAPPVPPVIRESDKAAPGDKPNEGWYEP
jgi:hypothetical protein